VSLNFQGYSHYRSITISICIYGARELFSIELVLLKYFFLLLYDSSITPCRLFTDASWRGSV